MPAIAAPSDPSTPLDGFSPFYYDVVSGDGTRLTAWTNDPDRRIDGAAPVAPSGRRTVTMSGSTPWSKTRWL